MHSPGPWTLTPVEPGQFRAAGEYEAKDFALVAKDLTCPAIIWDWRAFPEQEANARLIEQAPEMFALIKRIADGYEISMSEAQLVVSRVNSSR